MEILILNGEPDALSAFDGYVHDLAERLTAVDHEVRLVALRDLDLKGCSGCFGCWVKTPGECAKRDDSATVCSSMLASDLVVLSSPMVMGFTTALLKRVADQMIPLVHPYIVIDDGEMHHRARYDRYPMMGLVLGAGPDTDTEDLEITETMWSRTARNLKSSLVFTAVTDRSTEEVAHALSAAA